MQLVYKIKRNLDYSWLPEPLRKNALMYQCFDETYGCGAPEDITVKPDPFLGEWVTLPPKDLEEIGVLESWKIVKEGYVWHPAVIASAQGFWPDILDFNWNKITIPEPLMSRGKFVTLNIEFETISYQIGNRLLMLASFGLYNGEIYFDRRDY